MSTPSKQHLDFVKEPIGQKPPSKLPGIGSVVEANLKGAGITRAYHILGMFLYLDKDLAAFTSWLKRFGANEGHCKECFNALNEWYENHLAWQLE